MSGQLALELHAQSGLELAREWRAENPDAFLAIVRWAREDVDAGMRPSIDLYVNLLRRPHFARRLGLTWSDHIYLFNNNLRAELARLVMEEEPDLCFETRRSASDEPGAVNARP